MTCSRNDYVRIAALLKHRMPLRCGTDKNNRGEPTIQYRVWFGIVWDMSDIFAADNVSFDRNRFLTACGMEVGADDPFLRPDGCVGVTSPRNPDWVTHRGR